jgi:hypothetical protein
LGIVPDFVASRFADTSWGPLIFNRLGLACCGSETLPP